MSSSLTANDSIINESDAEDSVIVSSEEKKEAINIEEIEIPLFDEDFSQKITGQNSFEVQCYPRLSEWLWRSRI